MQPRPRGIACRAGRGAMQRRVGVGEQHKCRKQVVTVPECLTHMGVEGGRRRTFCRDCSSTARLMQTASRHAREGGRRVGDD